MQLIPSHHEMQALHTPGCDTHTRLAPPAKKIPTNREQMSPQQRLPVRPGLPICHQYSHSSVSFITSGPFHEAGHGAY